MKFFVDTANLAQIEEANDLGVLDGVTTNPSLMAREGIFGAEACREHYKKICEIVDGPISAEVMSTDLDEMIEEGRQLASIHKNIVVKVPATLNGIKAIRALSQEDIDTNCTLIFNVGQAVLAAKAGATYVSPFVGRIDDISGDGIQLVSDIVETFETYGFATEVIAASIRHTRHIIEAMEVNADIATCPLAAIKGLLKHPLTDSGLEAFLADQRRVAQEGK
ncbi:fructose-6-phosphate aldolase [Bacteroidales bacterium KA00251]|nr:fructose-6-phosphate aldolase [Bacteroidales bacterium KA00251]